MVRWHTYGLLQDASAKYTTNGYSKESRSLGDTEDALHTAAQARLEF